MRNDIKIIPRYMRTRIKRDCKVRKMNTDLRKERRELLKSLPQFKADNPAHAEFFNTKYIVRSYRSSRIYKRAYAQAIGDIEYAMWAAQQDWS